jgi:hypothetical protein
MIGPRPNHFVATYPRNRADLEACFPLLRDSQYYDPNCDLTEDEVIEEWDELLRTGVGVTLITKNPFYEVKYFSHSTSKFVYVDLLTFVTPKFARDVVSGNIVGSIGMEFLRQRRASRLGNELSPMPTVQEIKNAHATDGLIGMNLFVVAHPSIHSMLDEQTLPQDD